MPWIPVNVSRNGVAALSLQTKRLKRHSPKQLKMLIWLVFRIIMLKESQPIKNLWQLQGSCLPPILHHRPLDSEFHHWVATFIHRTFPSPSLQHCLPRHPGKRPPGWVSQSLVAPRLLQLQSESVHTTAYFPKRASRCFLLICLEAKANVHSAFCSKVVPTNRSNRNHCLQCLEPFYSECGPQSPGGSLGMQAFSRFSQSEPTP